MQNVEVSFSMEEGPGKCEVSGMSEELIKRFALVAAMTLVVLCTASDAVAERSVCGTEELVPIELTDEEAAWIREHAWPPEVDSTPPPPAGTRNPGEFEAATGVFVRWPMGLPYDLIVSFSQHTVVWVICESSEQGDVESAFSAAGVNMSNVDFLFASTNSIWIRDYGPWFLMLPDGSYGIFDYTYNRPRPLDDAIPGEVGSAWGVDVYVSDIVHTGGNWMSDGLVQAMSTNLVYDENGGNEDWVDSQMEMYLGIADYIVMDDPQSSYIDHIDCWAKILSPGKVMVLEVPPSHPDYANLEAAADLLAATPNSYGDNWEVYRVYSSGTEGYTNSLLHNQYVYLPVWNTSNDSPAVISYQEALPGYTVVPIYYSAFSNTDALHCRTRNVIDAEMLWIDHDPVDSPQPANTAVDVDALIRCHPDNSLTATTLYYRSGTSGPFTSVAMSSTGSDSFHAEVPGMAAGTTVQYYLDASDDSGRDEQHPRFAPSTWCHEYSVSGTGVEGEQYLVPGVSIAPPSSNPFSGSLTLAFSVDRPAGAAVRVFDLSGRVVADLYEGEVGTGSHDLTWVPSSQVPSGVYVVRYEISGEILTSRVTYLGRI